VVAPVGVADPLSAPPLAAPQLGAVVPMSITSLWLYGMVPPVQIIPDCALIATPPQNPEKSSMWLVPQLPPVALPQVHVAHMRASSTPVYQVPPLAGV
jgi:hypothetical protein